MKLYLTHKQIITYGCGIIAVFILASVSVSYTTNWADPISKSFKKLYPAALVDMRPISIEDADEFVALVRKLDSSVSADSAFQTFLTHKKSEALLRKLGIKIDSDSVSDELNFYKKTSDDSFSQLLETYFDGKEKLFIENVVFTEVVEIKLRIKYNSDHDLNKDAYTKAQNILSRLKAGEKFEDIAKKESDDKQSAQFGGDLGFFEHGQIIPELEKEITVAKTGEVAGIIVTRDGYEIVLPIETSMNDDVKKWHARHILIQTNGFEQWLTNQIKNISVKSLKIY